MSTVEGIFCSDLQWTVNPPVARSVEKNWLEVQRGYIQQLRNLQVQHKNAPIIMVGDLFEVWNSPAYLISNVIEWLKGMNVWAIPGNHDMPHHSYLELPRSAYWTLVEAGTIKHLTPGPVGTGLCSMTVYPFPYGFEVKPLEKRDSFSLHIAVVHNYIWTEKTGRPDAPEGQRYSEWMKKLVGYDAAFFGDNHIPFLMAPAKNKCTVMNCGTFMRRHSNEKDYRPRVGLLYSDGTIKQHFLDTSKDEFADMTKDSKGMNAALEIDLNEFAAELSNLHSEKLDFPKIVQLWLDKKGVTGKTKELMLKWTGNGGKK